MKNENVLQNFLAGLAGDQTEKIILPLDKRPQKELAVLQNFLL